MQKAYNFGSSHILLMTLNSLRLLSKERKMTRPTHTVLISEFSVKYAKPERRQSALYMRSFLVEEFQNWRQSSKPESERLVLHLIASWKDIRDLPVSNEQTSPAMENVAISLAWMEDAFQSLEILPTNDPTLLCLAIYRTAKP